LRRSAAQLHALAEVEREIRASDPNSRRKYLRDFSEAFRAYESVLSATALDSFLRSGDVLLVGDYHALPACQRYFANLVEELASGDERPVVVGLELALARDQSVLDEWMRGEIDEDELRDRLRFDLDWGYDWQPTCELFRSLRRNAQAIYGLDCMPRGDLRRIGARDRHAADKIGEIRRRHPGARIGVLFGESHLAPTHLPQELRLRLAGERIVTVLQNVDQLYWQAAGERSGPVKAVRVASDAVCVFNSTPLEKYESYRLCLERWRNEHPSSIDYAPTIYNLINALLRFLNVDPYCTHNRTQPNFLADLMPQVFNRVSEDQVRRFVLRRGGTERDIAMIQSKLYDPGLCYVPRLNAMFVRRLDMAAATDQVARFVHAACSGGLRIVPELVAGDDAFYTRALREALTTFGARVLHPARPVLREPDLYAWYTKTREEVEQLTGFTHRALMEMVDFLVLHKDMETNRYVELPGLIKKGLGYTGEQREFCARMLGQILGSEMYEAYVEGRLHKRFLRSLYFRNLNLPGSGRDAYFAIARRARAARKRLIA
jgi:hypothetical protein